MLCIVNDLSWLKCLQHRNRNIYSHAYIYTHPYTVNHAAFFVLFFFYDGFVLVFFSGFFVHFDVQLSSVSQNSIYSHCIVGVCVCVCVFSVQPVYWFQLFIQLLCNSFTVLSFFSVLIFFFFFFCSDCSFWCCFRCCYISICIIDREYFCFYCDFFFKYFFVFVVILLLLLF